MRRSLPRWAKWLAGAGGVVVVVCGAMALWFAAAMSGGFDNLLDVRRPEADDKRVVARGELAMRESVATADDIARDLSTEVPTLGGPLGGTGSTQCEEGQHNFKVDDDYDLRCTAHGIVAFRPTLAGGAADLRAIRAALTADGWSVDHLYPTDEDVAVLPTGGTLVGVYRRDGTQLDLRAVGPNGFFQGDRRYLDLPPFRADDGTEIPVADLPASAPPGAYTLLVETSRVYFEE